MGPFRTNLKINNCPYDHQYQTFNAGTDADIKNNKSFTQLGKLKEVKGRIYYFQYLLTSSSSSLLSFTAMMEPCHVYANIHCSGKNRKLFSLQPSSLYLLLVELKLYFSILVLKLLLIDPQRKDSPQSFLFLFFCSNTTLDFLQDQNPI